MNFLRAVPVWIWAVLVAAGAAIFYGWRHGLAVIRETKEKLRLAEADREAAKRAAIRAREKADADKEAQRQHDERAAVIKAELEVIKAEAETKKTSLDKEVTERGSAIDELNRRILERRNKVP